MIERLTASGCSAHKDVEILFDARLPDIFTQPLRPERQLYLMLLFGTRFTIEAFAFVAHLVVGAGFVPARAFSQGQALPLPFRHAEQALGAPRMIVSQTC